MFHDFLLCIYMGYVHDTFKLDSFDNLCRHEMRCLSPTIRCHRHLAPKKHQVSKLSLSVIAGDLLSLSLLTLTVCIIDTHPAVENKQPAIRSFLLCNITVILAMFCCCFFLQQAFVLCLCFLCLFSWLVKIFHSQHNYSGTSLSSHQHQTCSLYGVM